MKGMSKIVGADLRYGLDGQKRGNFLGGQETEDGDDDDERKETGETDDGIMTE